MANGNGLELMDIIWFIIPLVLIQIALMIASLVHVLRSDSFRFGSKIMWVVICLIVSIIGPVIYFAVGRGDD